MVTKAKKDNSNTSNPDDKPKNFEYEIEEGYQTIITKKRYNYIIQT